MIDEKCFNCGQFLEIGDEYYPLPITDREGVVHEEAKLCLACVAKGVVKHEDTIDNMAIIEG